MEENDQNQNQNASGKVLKDKNAISCGLEAGLYNLAINWVLLIIPALFIQVVLDVRHGSPTYVLMLGAFQIMMAFLTPYISIRNVGRTVNLVESPAKAAIISALTTIIIVFIIEVVIGTGTLVPFGSVFGFILFVLIYLFSSYIFRNRFLNK